MKLYRPFITDIQSDLLPNASGTLDIGSASLAFNSGYVDTFNANSINAAGNISANTFSGDGSSLTNVGASAASALSFSARVSEAGGISAGQAVYISGAAGQIPLVSLCDNTDSTKDGIAGIAAETKVNNQLILIRQTGSLGSLDTSAWSDGDILYMSTNGNLTNVLPTSGTVKNAGAVTYDHASQGIILVSVGIKSWYMAATSGEDLDIRLGDDGGSNSLSFENYSDENLLKITSVGDIVPSASGLRKIGTTALAFGEGNFDNLQVNATPSGGFDVANKDYVDAAISVETPGGSDTYVQFNDGGSFGGDAGLTYNKTTDQLTVNGATYDAQLGGSSQAGYFVDGTRTTTLANGTNAITASSAAGTVAYFNNGGSLNLDLISNGNYVLAGSDGTRTVELSNGTYAVYATGGASHFTDGTRIAEFASGGIAGQFTDTVRTVQIANGTYALDVTGDSDFSGNLKPDASGTRDIGAVQFAWDEAHINKVYLEGDPATGLEAATKNYVDNAVAAEDLWNRSGSTLSPSTANDNIDIGTGIVNAASGVLTGQIFVGGDGLQHTGTTAFTTYNIATIDNQNAGLKHVYTTGGGAQSQTRIYVNGINALYAISTDAAPSEANVSVPNGYLWASNNIYTQGGLYGETIASADLTIGSTSHATKGEIIVDSTMRPDASGTLDLGTVALAYDEAHINKVYLEGNPTTGFEAATKDYVDAATASSAPAGSDSQIQYNNGGVMGADPALVWDDASHIFSVYDAAGVDHLSLSNDGSNSNITWGDGALYFNTTEGTNTASQLIVKGRGTGSAYLWLEDGSSSNYRTAMLQSDTIFYIASESGVTEVNINGNGYDIDTTIQSNNNATMFKVMGDDTGVIITQGQAQDGLFVDQNGNGRAVDIDTEATTSFGLNIEADALTTGKIAYFYSNSSDASTRNLVHIKNDNASSSNARTFRIEQDGPAQAALITTSSTSSNAVDVTADSLTTGNLLNLSSNSSSSGTRRLVNILNDHTSATGTRALVVQNDADNTVIGSVGVGATADLNRFDGDFLTTGRIGHFYSNSSDASTRSLVRIVNDHVDATGATCLEVRQDSTGSAIKTDGDIETGSTDAFYMGDPTTDGTWRFVRSGNDLIFQRRESSTWVTKSTVTA